MTTKRMGFEGQLFWGPTAGTTAATELTICRDVSYGFDPEFSDTSDRASIINMNDVAGINFDLEFECNNDSDNTFVAALRVAAAAGTALPFKTVDFSGTGGWGVDGDFVIKIEQTEELRNRQSIKVTLKPTDKGGRVPVWAVTA